MAKPTRRDVALMPVVLGAVAATRAEAQTSVPALDNASLAEVQEALAKGAPQALVTRQAQAARKRLDRAAAVAPGTTLNLGEGP